MSPLLAHLQSFFSDSLRQQISAAVGEPLVQTNQAMEAALPVLLTVLAEFTNDVKGSAYVLQAVENESKSGLLEHLDNVLEGHGLDLLLRQGDTYTARFFNENSVDLHARMERVSGLSSPGTYKFLSMVVPIVLAVLGNFRVKIAVSGPELMVMLREQKADLLAKMPGLLRGLFSPVAIREANETGGDSIPAGLIAAHPDLHAPPRPTATQKLSGAALPASLPLQPVVKPKPNAVQAHKVQLQGWENPAPQRKNYWAWPGFLAFLISASFLYHQWPLTGGVSKADMNPQKTEIQAQPKATEHSNVATKMAPKPPEENSPAKNKPPEDTPSLLALPSNDPALTISSALLPVPGIRDSLVDGEPATTEAAMDPELSILPGDGEAVTGPAVASAPVKSGVPSTAMPQPSETPVNPDVPDPVEIPVETVKLPNGRPAKISRTGLDGQLHDFLSNTTPAETTLIFDQVVFEEKRAVPEENSARQLEAVAALLKAWPDAKATIRAHTDDEGKPAANLILSSTRANALRKKLVSLGVRASQLEAKGLGSTKPLVPNDSDENRQKNQRIELVVKRK